jgi:hypothetical protein
MKQTVPTNSTAKNSWARNVGSIRNQSSQNKIKVEADSQPPEAASRK